MNKMEAIEAFCEYEDAKTVDDLYFQRLGIDGAIARLRQIKADLDAELILRMAEAGIKEFQYGEPGQGVKVKAFKESKKTIKDTKVLREMLWCDDEAKRDMARKALSESQSAWKTAQVRVLADTLGLDLIETTWTDKIVVAVIPNSVEAKQ